MTFNIAHGRGLSLYQGFHSTRSIGRNLDRVARVIVREQPDIVALQEVDERSHWNRHINLLDYLQAATGYPYARHGIHNTRVGRKPLAYGNAFLSKFPIERCEVVPFGEKSIGEKGFMDAQFRIRGALVDVINLHLDFRSRRARLRQAARILEKIENRYEAGATPLPPIICGDFNSGSRAIRDALRHIVEETSARAAYDYYPKRHRNFPAHLPSRGLDFFLVAKPFRNARARPLRCFASDHFPVVLKFELDRKRRLPAAGLQGAPAKGGRGA